MRYVEIDIAEFRRLFKRYGYIMHNAPGAAEQACSKAFPEKKILVWFWTTFVKGKQREKNKDAIRCLLLDFSCDKLFFQLKAVRRITQWKELLAYRIYLLERIVTASEPCHYCGAPMVPRIRRNWKYSVEKYYISWKCSEYPDDHLEVFGISDDLQRLIKMKRFRPSRDPKRQARKKQLQKEEFAKIQGTLFPE